MFDSTFDQSQYLVCFIAGIMTVISHFKVTANVTILHLLLLTDSFVYVYRKQFVFICTDVDF